MTESHLNEYISNNEIDIKDWTVHRSDRSKRIGGGILSYVKNHLIVSDKIVFSNSYCEILGFYIPNINLLNLTIYRPPNCPSEKFCEVIKLSTEWLNNFEKRKINPIINFNGDFNFPFMSTWTEESISNLMENYENRRSKNTDYVIEGKTLPKLKLQSQSLHIPI